MITLLDRVARAGRGPGVLGDRSASLLEWSRVTDQVAAHCLGSLAAERIRRRRPFADPDSIALYHALADELRTDGDADAWPPLIDVGPALGLIRRPPPIRLEGEDLVHLAGVAEEADRMRAHFLADRDRFGLWAEAAVQAAVFSGLGGAIRRALDRDGRIVDDASPLLGRLRRALGGQEQAVRQEVGRSMQEARGRGWTTGDEVTLRGDRYCLPLRAGDSRRVDGIVHDRSASGATLFVEPAGVVRLANELAATRLEIAAEEARILFELNRAVEQASPALEEALELMVLLDEVRATLLWSRRVGGVRPLLATGRAPDIRGGRHPLLMEAFGAGDPAAGREAVVPLDLALPEDARVLVISGPNAGGKSVALKSVGVLCLLAQCGWDVPAAEGTALPLVDRVLTDLGDEQSIAESLSSFSAHLRHLARFLEVAGPGSLVLCDEIGTGTDPQEGTALAFAVLEDLADRGALVLASTHYGLLKAAVHDHPAMVNAAMDYDERDLRPLFTFRVGDPGTSHAFDIAARMGLAPELLARARTRAGEERVQVETLLADLDRRARELADAREELRLVEGRVRDRDRDLTAPLEELEREQRRVLDEARREAEDLVREGRRAIENSVREIRSSGADRAVVRTARDRLERLGRAAGSAPATPPGPADVAVGDRVRIPHLNLTGRVLEVRGERIVADAQGLRLTVGIGEVRLPDGPADAPADETPTGSAGGWGWEGEPSAAPHEIDLRGLTGEEGWARLDRLLDRAIPAGLAVVHVIHGFGTGRLRDHLHARLAADPRVASFREAGPGRGGGGATRVEIQS